MRSIRLRCQGYVQNEKGRERHLMVQKSIMRCRSAPGHMVARLVKNITMSIVWCIFAPNCAVFQRFRSCLRTRLAWRVRYALLEHDFLLNFYYLLRGKNIFGSAYGRGQNQLFVLLFISECSVLCFQSQQCLYGTRGRVSLHWYVPCKITCDFYDNQKNP